jgi:vacuolar-type H+-ATPase subunit I/STV1
MPSRDIESLAPATGATFFLDPEGGLGIYLVQEDGFLDKRFLGGRVMRARAVLGAVLGALLLGHLEPTFGQGFDQQDRERLVRLEATLLAFMQQSDKRFAELREDMNKRFEQVDKRFEQLDKRIDDLRQETNSRLEEMRQDTNKRFEQVDKRIEQLITFLWILAGIFTALVVAVIAFAYWDRRTIIRRAKEEALKEMQEAGRWKTILEALRQVAIKDSNVAEALRRFNLL